MRNRWYGDDRDLVKWGGLVQLAKRHQLQAILQVAYLRREQSLPLIMLDGQEIEIPAEVWNHFRDVAKVVGLAVDGLTIDVLTDEFDPADREAYAKRVISHAALLTCPKAVFLGASVLMLVAASPARRLRR